MKQLLWILPSLLMFAGCGAQTTGKEIRIENRFVFENIYGAVTVTPNLSTKSGDVDQITENPNEITTPIDLVMTPAEKMVAAVTNLADARILEKVAEVKAKTPSPVIDKKEKSPVDNDDATKEDIDPLAEYKHHETIAMHSVYGDGRTFYRLGYPGEHWGKKLLVVGNTTGDEFLVPDTSYNFGNRTGKFFFNGNSTGANDNKLEPTFDNNASLFWQVDESVTLYYNGEGE